MVLRGSFSHLVEWQDHDSTDAYGAKLTEARHTFTSNSPVCTTVNLSPQVEERGGKHEPYWEVVDSLLYIINMIWSIY